MCTVGPYNMSCGHFDEWVTSGRLGINFSFRLSAVSRYAHMRWLGAVYYSSLWANPAPLFCYSQVEGLALNFKCSHNSTTVLNSHIPNHLLAVLLIVFLMKYNAVLRQGPGKKAFSV